jgi:hypothetical protein
MVVQRVDLSRRPLLDLTLPYEEAIFFPDLGLGPGFSLDRFCDFLRVRLNSQTRTLNLLIDHGRIGFLFAVRKDDDGYFGILTL